MVKDVRGETLIDPEFRKVLNKVVELGLLKLISHLITNATSWNKRIADTISLNLNTLQSNFSFDGTGKLEEYLRHGTKWDRHEEILHEVFKLS